MADDWSDLDSYSSEPEPVAKPKRAKKTTKKVTIVAPVSSDDEDVPLTRTLPKGVSAPKPKKPKAPKAVKAPKAPKAVVVADPDAPAPKKKAAPKKKPAAKAAPKSFCCGKGSRGVTFSSIRSDLKKQYTIFKRDNRSKKISHAELFRHTISFAGYLSSVFSSESETDTRAAIDANLIAFMQRKKISGYADVYLQEGPHDPVLYQQRALVETVVNSFLEGEQTLEAWAKISLGARKLIK